MKRFEEIKIGEKAEIIHTITNKDIERFVTLTGDDNKIHIDKAYAAKTSFKKPVAHGMLSASFISTIIGTKLPGDGALWFSQTLEFLLPVRVGDTITITAEVVSKLKDLNAIEIKTDIYNQNRQKVISGKARVKIVEQETLSDLVETGLTLPKVALVIGATGGIGSATCIKLASLGFDVAVHYNTNESKADELVEAVKEKNQKGYAIHADITDEVLINDLIEKVERRLGGITLLLNCATNKLVNIKFENLKWQDLTEHIDINLKSNFFLLRNLVPKMKAQGGGKIILITSQVTENTPPSEWLPYVAAKYALNGFAKAIAVELAPHNVKVNLVSPGMTETDLLAEIPEKARILMAAKTPMRRLASPLDIANAIGFLASSDADYITGETLRINGGMSMI